MDQPGCIARSSQSTWTTASDRPYSYDHITSSLAPLCTLKTTLKEDLREVKSAICKHEVAIELAQGIGRLPLHVVRACSGPPA